MMSKPVFYNRFNRAKDTVRILSPFDCVDRVSYVDQPTLVKRFISEGKTLSMYRAQSLYKSYEDAASSDDMALPVFPEDIAITQARLKLAEDEMQQRLKNKTNLNDSSSADANPSSTKDKGIEGKSINSDSPAVV